MRRAGEADAPPSYASARARPAGANLASVQAGSGRDGQGDPRRTPRRPGRRSHAAAQGAAQEGHEGLRQPHRPQGREAWGRLALRAGGAPRATASGLSASRPVGGRTPARHVRAGGTRHRPGPHRAVCGPHADGERQDRKGGAPPPPLRSWPRCRPNGTRFGVIPPKHTLPGRENRIASVPFAPTVAITTTGSWARTGTRPACHRSRPDRCHP